VNSDDQDLRRRLDVLELELALLRVEIGRDRRMLAICRHIVSRIAMVLAEVAVLKADEDPPPS